FMVKDKLRKLLCSSTVRFKLDQLLDSLEFNEKQVLKTTREIRRFCQNDPELSQCIKYMMSVSGIGWIVASQLLARIGDWRKLSVRISVVLMQQRPYVVREKVHSAPLTQEETSPQGTTRRQAEPGDKDS